MKQKEAIRIIQTRLKDNKITSQMMIDAKVKSYFGNHTRTDVYIVSQPELLELFNNHFVLKKDVITTAELRNKTKKIFDELKQDMFHEFLTMTIEKFNKKRYNSKIK